MISRFKFRNILNDIKRRSIDAANELGISENKIKDYLSGNETIPFSIIKKAVKIWPVNYSEFFSIIDDASSGYKIMTKYESDLSKRLMYRSNKPYYLYKDTATSRVAPFKPEWIEELMVVEDNNPNNSNIIFNNGHFLHQFTYFIGEVNFYYILNGSKKVTKMNTGDSVYISPYISHSFATRKNKENKNGIILALTYSDKLDYASIDELSAIGKNLTLKFKLEVDNNLNAFKSNLKYFLKVASINVDELKFRTKIKDIDKIFSINKIPSYKLVSKIAKVINVNIKDLLPIHDDAKVKILKYSKSKKFFFPSLKLKSYSMIELVGVKKLPLSRAFELIVNQDINNESKESEIECPLHQYIYNIGSKNCKIRINKTIINLDSEDSIYLKPNILHRFIGKEAKLLILRTGGKSSGDTLSHFSMINEENLSRVIQENVNWFNE